MVMTAAWLCSVCWSTRKNSPRCRVISVTCIDLPPFVQSSIPEHAVPVEQEHEPCELDAHEHDQSALAPAGDRRLVLPVPAALVEQGKERVVVGRQVPVTQGQA